MACRSPWRTGAAHARSVVVERVHRGHRTGLEFPLVVCRAPSFRRGRIRVLPRVGTPVPYLVGSDGAQFGRGYQGRGRALGSIDHTGTDGLALHLPDLATSVRGVRRPRPDLGRAVPTL